jgi:diphthine synthase
MKVRNLKNGLVLISIGIHNEKDMSLRGIEEARACDDLYAELYTMLLNTNAERLSALIGRPVNILKRRDLEENSGEIIEKARSKRIGILVGGDSLSFTTHISLLIEAKKKGIMTKVVHGSSIFSAVAETGLSLYKFGKTVTLPLPIKGPVDTVITVLNENLENSLHTLILLDLDVETGIHLTINQAIKILIEAEKFETFNEKTPCVAIARVGWKDSIINADTASEIRKFDFGMPPHALIVPGQLHFLEAQALEIIGGYPPAVLNEYFPKGDFRRLFEKYVSSSRKAINELKFVQYPKTVTREIVNQIIDHASRYLNDAEYYVVDQRATALASVSYVEGILDALKLLGLVDFEW